MYVQTIDAQKNIYKDISSNVEISKNTDVKKSKKKLKPLFILKKIHLLQVNVLVWQQCAALWWMVNNDGKLSSSFLQQAVSRFACLPVYGLPPSQRGIVLLLLYTMWVVKPENELTLYQQHLVLVHFLRLLLMRKNVSTSLSRQSPKSLNESAEELV